MNNTRSRWPRCSPTHKDRCTVHKHRALQQRSHQAAQPHQLRSLYMYISTYTPSLFQICSYDHSLRYCFSFCYGDRIVRCSSKTQFSMTSADRWSLRYKSSCMAYTPAMLYRRLEVLPFPWDKWHLGNMWVSHIYTIPTTPGVCFQIWRSWHLWASTSSAGWMQIVEPPGIEALVWYMLYIYVYV